MTGSDSLTVQRLLEAAVHEFACHGFASTRIRDVADGADANLAAVNYHFGDKEGFHRATLAMPAERSRDEMPHESPALRRLPLEDRFRAFARLMLTRLAVATQWIFLPFARRVVEIQGPALAKDPGLVLRIADDGLEFCLAAIQARRAQRDAPATAAKADGSRAAGFGATALTQRPIATGRPLKSPGTGK